MTITLPLAEAIQAFSAVLPHVAKDNSSQAITEVRITSCDESPAYLIATDRFSVARYELTATTAETFRIPRAAVVWISKIAVASLRRAKLKPDLYELHIKADATDTTVTILYDGYPEQSQSFDLACSANFPPVERLIIDADKANPTDAYPFAIAPLQLEKLTGYSRKFAGGAAIRFTQTPAGSRLPGPLMFSIGKLSGLIQPVKIEN